MKRLIDKGALISLALVLASLATRAVYDKMLALSPDWTLVAHWAQAQSLFELTAAVAVCGVGQGLTVFAARKGENETLLMRDGLAWGLIVSGSAAVALIVVTPWINAAFAREVAPAGAIGAVAVIGGLLATAPALFSFFWQGRRERGKMLALLLVAWAPMALGASGLFGAPDLQQLLWIQLFTQTFLSLILFTPILRALFRGGERALAPSWRASPLRRYIFAGVSIGLLSPASMMWTRAELAHGLSWNEVAQLTALWRTSEWVIGLAGGLLGLVFLPRMAAATGRAPFLAELFRTWRLLCLPAACLLVLLWAGQRVIVPILYSDQFVMPAAAAALFLLGDALRLSAWVPLQGLFATERVTAIAIGEWLSLPLFATLLTCVPQPTLEKAGACYAVTYAIYLAFNIFCIFRVRARYAAVAA